MGGHKKAHESAWSLLAVLLSLAMIFAGFPTAALAEAAEELNPAPIEENADGTPSQEEESSQPAQSPQELATSTRDELTDSGLAAKAAAKVSATAPSDAQGTELVKALFEGTLDALASNADDSALGQAYGDSPDAAIVAGAFAAIVEELGLKCAIVADGTEDVLWDLVEVDGLWYHVDAWSAHAESREGGSAEASVEDLENAWLLVGDDAIATRDNTRNGWKVVGESADTAVLAAASDSYAWDAAEAPAESEDDDQASEAAAESEGPEPQSQDEKADAGDTTLVVQADDASDLASGTWGTCDWEITSDGELVIHPGAGESDSTPWSDLGYDTYSQIKSVRFAAEGTNKVVAPTSCRYLFGHLSGLETVDLSGLDTSATESMAFMFYTCTSLRTVDLSGIDTSNVTDMSGMFSYCTSLVTLDVSSLDTGKATNMNGMFAWCKSLTALDLSTFDTSKVTDMRSMFEGCQSLRSLTLTSFDTGSVTDMVYMFHDCSSLERLDLSSFDTAAASKFTRMFEGCTSLAQFSVGTGWSYKSYEMCPRYTSSNGKWWSSADNSWLTRYEIARGRSGVADTYDNAASTAATNNVLMSGVWGTCAWDLDIDGRLVIHAGRGTDIEGDLAIGGKNNDWITFPDQPWGDARDEVRTVTFESGANLPEDCHGLFAGCKNLTDIDFSSCDASSVITMRGMFAADEKLEHVTLGSIDTSNVTDMSVMFSKCTNVAFDDLSKLDTSSVTSMQGMFSAWQKIDPNVGKLDTSSVTDMRSVFSGASSDIDLDLTDWDVSKVTDMELMFFRTTLKSLDISGWNAASLPADSNAPIITDDCTINMPFNGSEIDYLVANNTRFPTCDNLFFGSEFKSLDLSSWDVSGIYNFESMFSGCSNLESVNLSGWDTSSATDFGSMFFNCSSLTSLDIADWDTSSVTDMAHMFSGCSKLEALDLSKWDISNVVGSGNFTGLNGMFYNCSALRHLNLSGWNNENAVSARVMFIGCTSLQSITVGAKYQMKTAAGIVMFPFATADTDKWWSTADQQWYTVDEIAESRSGIADTYASSEVKTLSPCTATLSPSTYVYDGSQKSPTLTVKDGSKTLAPDTDYTVTTPSDRTNTGTYTYTIIGKGDYTGIKSASFTISPKPLSSCTVSLSPSSFIYDGTQKTPTVTVKDGSEALTAGTDYDVIIPGGRTDEGTYTYTVTGKGNYTGTKSASMTISAPRALGLDDLSYSFSNSRSAFGYTDPYYIPLESYRIVFGEATAQFWYEFDDDWGGSCHGMSATTRMFNTPESGLEVSDFSPSATKVDELSPSDTNSDTGLILTRYIEAMQVSQRDSAIQTARRDNRDNLDGLCEAVLESKQTGKLVDIGVYGLIDSKVCGHSIVGYDVQTVSSTQKRIYVYDCNFPKETRYITVSTNSSGKCTGWYYHLNDKYDWGSSYSGSYINYTPYSAVESVWNGGGGTHATNSLATNSQSFEVLDGEGKLVARVADGKLTQSASDVWQYIPTAPTDDGAEGGGDKNVTIYMPNDAAYSVKSADQDLNQLEIGMANSEQSAIVTTDASEVTFAVNDAENVNLVDVEAGAGETYSVVLNSDLPSASGQESIELSGIGNGQKLSIGMLSGNCIVVNGKTASLVVNGETVDIGSRIGIVPQDASLEYTVCDYNGKAHEPKVTVEHDGASLVEDRDFVVKYSNNVEPGTAKASVYGIGDYDGRVELTFKIKLDQTITASNKSVAMGKTVSLGAKTSGDGKLTYKSSDTGVAKVSSTGVVTPVKTGTAKVTITAAATNNYKKATKTVTVTVTKGTSTIKLIAQSKTYTGKALAYSLKPTRTGSKGKVTYKYYSDAKCTKAVSAANVKAARTYYVRATVAADDNYKAATSAAAKFTITKAANPMRVSVATKTVAYSKVKAGAQTVAPITVTKAQGTKSFAVTKWTTTKAKGYFTVNKTTGKVTAKKGTPKGTYKFQVKVTAKGNSNYKSASKTVTVTIVVK